jgi:hypothetical protein
MALSKFEQGKFEQARAQLESALGEPVLRCVGVSAAGQQILGWGGVDSPFWRPYLTVNGQPHTPVPRTMFLILTPTRVVITGLRNYAPQLDAPILILQRGDAEITATRKKGTWTYFLRSRASGAELDLELKPPIFLTPTFPTPTGGVAADLAEQLREFSVTPTTPDATPKVGYNRRSALRRFRRLNALVGIGALVVSLVGFGVGAYSVYAYQAGTPTKATIVSCWRSKGTGRTCQGTWTIDGASHRGRINGKLDDSQKVGSSVDVHVFGGKAYTTAWDKWWFIAGGVVGGLGLFVLLFPLYRKRDE